MSNIERAPRERKRGIMVYRLPKREVIAEQPMRAALAAMEEVKGHLDDAATLKGDDGELREERALGAMHAVMAQHITALRMMLREGQ